MPFASVRCRVAHWKLLNLPVSASSNTAQRFFFPAGGSFVMVSFISEQSGKHSEQPSVMHGHDGFHSIEPEESTTIMTNGGVARRSGSSARAVCTIANSDRPARQIAALCVLLI